jgi:MFS family permease
MFQVIAGRVVSGSAGAGMGVLISVSITDLVPIREVPTWRAYIMLVGTLGRSLGAPLGGLLADTIGWRLSFSIQGPLLFFTALLVWLILPRKASTPGEGQEPKLSALEQVAQIDFLGAITLGLLITSTLIPLELGGVVLPWSHPLIMLFFGLTIALLVVFIVIEKHWAKDPILPLEIFANTPLVLCYGITLLQVAAMVGVCHFDTFKLQCHLKSD